MTPAAPALDPFPDDWTTGLCVVAHPDDLEYGAAMAVARWTAAGKEISYVLATAGEAGIDGWAPERTGPVREREERASAAIVGVDRVTFLAHPDGVLEHGLPLRRDLAREIRRHRPDVVISINFQLGWGSDRPGGGGGGLNQADHRALGLALIDATRDAGNRWVFEELLVEGFQPWSGTRWAAFAGSPTPTHFVEVGRHLDQGIRSLRAHQAYLEHLGDPGFDPAAFITAQAVRGGVAAGVEHALTFELFDL